MHTLSSTKAENVFRGELNRWVLNDHERVYTCIFNIFPMENDELCRDTEPVGGEGWDGRGAKFNSSTGSNVYIHEKRGTLEL